MPKDTKERRYLNPAIPRASRLFAYLEQISTETGIAESQLLVLFASEYVRLVIDGSGIVPAIPLHQTPLPIQAGSMAVSGTRLERVEIPGGMRTLEPTSTCDDENFESFGDPD